MNKESPSHLNFKYEKLRHIAVMSKALVHVICTEFLTKFSPKSLFILPKCHSLILLTLLPQIKLFLYALSM